MTVVNPKSISGINSITMASGSDNLLTIHTTNTTERVRVNSDGDVIVGSGITVSPDGDIFATGVCTATSFVGDGSALTGVANTDVVFTDKLSVGDAPELISVGVGSDFQISHNGGTGNTNIIQQTGSVYFYTGSDLNLLLKDGAEVALYHANTKQCETSANGLAFPSGKGIDFSATSDAGGMTSELLDDYEEGTFTPTYSFSSSTGTFTYDAQIGRYTKIGNRCFFSVIVRSTGHSGTTNGLFRIANLPFNVLSDAPSGGTCFFISGGNFSANYGVATQLNTSEQIEFYKQVTSTGNNYNTIEENELNLGGLFVKVEGHYQVDQ